MMLRCGLLGRTLGHSYSPEIHALLADYEYRLYEKTEAEVGDFLKNGRWDGLNVTIPYKKTAIKYCDELSETASATGSVNTLVKRNGKVFGDNTDVFGFLSLVRRSGIDVSGKKTLVLGSGGASSAVCFALNELGADVTVISRSGEDNYGNLDRHRDAEVIVNTTPLGMYPDTGFSAVDLSGFPKLKGALDVVYNPARTAFLLQAESLGVRNANGLYMLAAQAKRSCELFCSRSIPEEETERVYRILSRKMENIILIGMPGCGKSTVAEALGRKTGRPVADTDELIVKSAGIPIPEIFKGEGEPGFRALETRAVSDAGKLSGHIISTGGGCVTREENYNLLHQNGVIVWIKRDLNKLPSDGRPLSQKGSLEEMYKAREPLYLRFADVEIENDGTPEETAERILDALT
ncbi:MAG: shikimate kinase [Oscillospiraceae bacterium]|nr:shikimate kinase [Oscillospiraceae bacterium]